MRSIGDFFKKIQNARAGSFFIHATIAEVVKKHISIEVPLEAIHIQSTKVTLQGISQAARNEIFIKRNGLIAEINTLLGKTRVTEIR
ncbi:MAG: hypothetical protein AAB381_01425 [Patescibacteria group bacterium]